MEVCILNHELCNAIFESFFPHEIIPKEKVRDKESMRYTHYSKITYEVFM